MRSLFLQFKKKILIGSILLILTSNCIIFADGNLICPKSTVTCTPNICGNLQPQSELFSQSTYEPEDIDLTDVSYHKSSGRFHVEWWYFEGIFNNGYNCIATVIVLSKGGHGLCMLNLHIFHNNDTGSEFFKRKIIPFQEFEASEKFPFVKIYGKQVIELDRERYNTTGEWVYNVSLGIDGKIANLQFIGRAKGWQGGILGGWYGPVLPMATVNGTLLLDGKKINVSGIGIHEHAWGITLPIREWGYYWGKISGDSLTLFWGKMMQTRGWDKVRAATLAQDQGDYINIRPENINFKATKYIFDHGRFIPTKFVLNVADPVKDIYVNASIETVNFYFYPIGIFHYWRYLVRVNGCITYGSTTEVIKDELQIMELTRFQ